MKLSTPTLRSLVVGAIVLGTVIGSTMLMLALIFPATPAPEPDCVYTFRMPGETLEYCAVAIVPPVVPTHVCFSTPDNDYVCLPQALAIARRSL